MKLQQFKCPTCGSPIALSPDLKIHKCSACNNTFSSFKEEPDISTNIYINQFSSENIQELAIAAYMEEDYTKNKLESTEIYQIYKNLNNLLDLLTEIKMDEQYLNLKVQTESLKIVLDLKNLIWKRN